MKILSPPRRFPNRPARRRADPPAVREVQCGFVPRQRPGADRPRRAIDRFCCRSASELDRRIVSVVQFGGDTFDRSLAAAFARDRGDHRRGERPAFARAVTLARDEDEAVGFAEDPSLTTARTGSWRQPRSTPCGSSTPRRNASTSTTPRSSGSVSSTWRSSPSCSSCRPTTGRVGLRDRAPAAGSRGRRRAPSSTRPPSSRIREPELHPRRPEQPRE